ncbi:MAG: hypothetical protein IJD13_00415 [Oscillospiraceae bacterium]|nr:hypothetical protein [Oscillospiraceae bacterium]
MEQTFQTAAQPVSRQEPRPRRIGTVTMGLSLVGAGGVLLAGQFGLVNALEVLRFAPAILILLGIEILIGSALNKSGRVRYDFLSMLVCFILIGLSAVGALIPAIITYDRSYSDMRSILSNRLEEKIAAAVGEKDIAGLDIHVWDYAGSEVRFFTGDFPTAAEMAAELEKSGGYSCDISLELSGFYDEAYPFAAKSREVCEDIAALDLPLDRLTLSGSEPDGSRFELHLDRWSLDLPVEELKMQVQGNVIG